MGHSIAISGRLSFPPRRREALRALVIDARSFDDWPSEGLFGAGDGAPATVDQVLAAFDAEARTKVEWKNDDVRVMMIVPAGAEAWVRGGRNLIALFRAAGTAGAQGGVALTGFTDGGPSEVISINTKGDGSSSVAVLTGTPAERAALAIHQLVGHLADEGRTGH